MTQLISSNHPSGLRTIPIRQPLNSFIHSFLSSVHLSSLQSRDVSLGSRLAGDISLHSWPYLDDSRGCHRAPCRPPTHRHNPHQRAILAVAHRRQRLQRGRGVVANSVSNDRSHCRCHGGPHAATTARATANAAKEFQKRFCAPADGWRSHGGASIALCALHAVTARLHTVTGSSSSSSSSCTARRTAVNLMRRRSDEGGHVVFDGCCRRRRLRRIHQSRRRAAARRHGDSRGNHPHRDCRLDGL